MTFKSKRKLQNILLPSWNWYSRWGDRETNMPINIESKSIEVLEKKTHRTMKAHNTLGISGELSEVVGSTGE